MTRERQPQRPAANANDLLDELTSIRFVLADILGVLHDQAAASQPRLYCPPYEHCPGGFPLQLSTVKDEKRPEEDRRDRFYHPLPESEWYDIETKQGTLHARSHNVWRSKALTYDEAMSRGLIREQDDDYGDDAAVGSNGHVMSDSDGGEAQSAIPGRFANVGQFLQWCRTDHELTQANVCQILQVEVRDLQHLDFAQAELAIIEWSNGMRR